MNSEVITREDLKNVFGALGEGDYGTRIDALENLLAVKELSISWSYCGSIYMWKSGNVVTCCIWNPKNLPAGQTDITTLPIGWRPKHDCAFLAIPPAAGTIAKPLRYQIYTNGQFFIYNYSSAFTGDSNAATSFSYVTA